MNGKTKTLGEIQVLTQKNKVLTNAVVTYGRTVISAAISLFSSRWVLNGLGVADYGVYVIVGSIVVFVVFLNSILASGVSRYLAYSIGAGDKESVVKWFNVAFSAHLIFATVLLVAGLILGPYIVGVRLNIQDAKRGVAVIVFDFNVIAAYVTMVSVPFQAMFSAKQEMIEQSFWLILQSCLTLILAYFVGYYHGDRLLLYAGFMCVIYSMIQLVQVVRAFIRFDECTIKIAYLYDKQMLKQLISYSGWVFFGGAGTVIRDQGSAILLNLQFGTHVNAAYGIANQVSMQVNQLSASLIRAFTPEIAQREGRGDREGMLRLAINASRYGSISTLLFAIPVAVEMEYLLKVWLKNPPDSAAMMCRLILVTFCIERLSTGAMLAINAHGKIAAYQVTVGSVMMLSIPVAMFLFFLGMPAYCIGVAFVISMVFATVFRMFWMNGIFNSSWSEWFGKVVLPCFVIVLFSAGTGVVFKLFLPLGLLRLVIITVSSIVIESLLLFIVFFDAAEKHKFFSIFKKIWEKPWRVS